jgi:cytoskeletal protein RodZ
MVFCIFVNTGMFYFEVVALPFNNGTTESTTGVPTTGTTQKPPSSLSSRGLVIGIACLVGAVFLVVVGLLIYKNFRKNNATHPMTIVDQQR